MKVDIKSLIYEVLTESLYGKPLTLKVGKFKLPALISKNVKPDEEPYRLTWFVTSGAHFDAGGHLQLTSQEVNQIMTTNKLSPEHERDLQRNFLIDKVPITIDFTAPKLVECIDLLNESMNVNVAGANYSRTDRLDSLVSHLLTTVVSPILHKIPEDQQEYFRKNSVGFYNMLVADGSYYSGTDPNKGTINLYTNGIIISVLQNILKSIFAELRKLGVKWGKVKHEQSGAFKSKVIRIPIIKNNSIYSGPPELNMSNRNAMHMFKDVLQFEDHDYTFIIDAKELKERVESIIKHDPSWLKNNTIDTKIDNGEPEPDENDPTLAADYWKDEEKPKSGGVTVYNMGVDEPYLKERLQAILEIAEWAIKNGHDKIHVG